MLFKSKQQFFISEKQIKEVSADESGRVILKINLRYPELKCGKKDPLAHNARDFYPRVADGFLHGAKTDLLSAARKSSQSEGFLPYSATMRWEKTFESEDYLSVVLYFTVSDGKNQTVEVKTQVWERKFGTKCPITAFIKKDGIRKFCVDSGVLKKELDISLFLLRANGVELFYRRGEELKSIIYETESAHNA